MKNKFIVFILSFFMVFSLYAENSYLNLNKLRKMIQKKEVIKKADSHTDEIKKTLPIIKPTKANFQIKQDNKKQEPPFIKPEFLGMIMNHSYKAVLIKYNEQYLYLKEGERDLQSKIKIIKIKQDKVILKIDKKRVEIEVDDE